MELLKSCLKQKQEASKDNTGKSTPPVEAPKLGICMPSSGTGISGKTKETKTQGKCLNLIICCTFNFICAFKQNSKFAELFCDNQLIKHLNYIYS